MMWRFLFHFFLWVSSLQSELNDLLSATDSLFEEFHIKDNSDFNTEALKQMLKRTYNLNDDHRVSKRSVEDEKLIQDKYGVFLLDNIQDVNKIPVKFSNDINIFSTHNLLYIAALEANGTNPEKQAANDLVLYHYSTIQGIKEIGRVPVLGGVKIAVCSFHNITFLVAAEYEAKEKPDLYQGSVVYKMTEKSGRIFLEKIQILNVLQPNDVKFLEHQDQLYLVIGTNMGKDSRRSGTLIYRWLGYHFDCLQVISSKNVKSVMPFSMGSFMYLALANYEDENGNSDIESEIFQFNLHEMIFKPMQTLKTHGARSISHFNFKDPESGDSEHFLIVANSLGKNSDEGLSSFKESVVYKFNNHYFIPFQSFKLQGIREWLPIKGLNGEFLLLASYSNGVVGFQYDGWRFSPVSLEFGQSFFGDDIQSMRAFYYFGDLFLTIADKSSYGNKINLWKLSFTNKNELENHYKELESWCNEMKINLTKDDFENVLKEFGSELDESPDQSEPYLKAENLLAEDSNQEMLDEINVLNEKIKNLESLLEEAEEEMQKQKSKSELPIIFGSKEMDSFELKCKTENCCEFKNLKVENVNNENFEDFWTNTVGLDENLISSFLEFEHVVLENDLSSSMVNGHPSETLIDVSSSTLINAKLIVNGTVFINDELKVNGLFNGVPPDPEHMLETKGVQNIEENGSVDSLKVKNLNLPGLLNGEPIESLSRKAEINLPTYYEELRVNNMNLEGVINGYNLTELFKKPQIVGNQEIHGDLRVSYLEVDEVEVDSNEISNVSISKILEAMEDEVCRSHTDSTFKSDSWDSEVSNIDEDDSEESLQKIADEYIVIVEGILKAKELSDESNSTSLLRILDESLKLNEPVINSDFSFSDVVTSNFETEIVNEVPVSSWILKNSDEVQYVYGTKTFLESVHVREEVSAERINNVELKELEKNILMLEGDQIIQNDLKVSNIKCREINTNYTIFGKNTFDKINKLVIHGSVLADRLEVDNLTLSGDIDSLSWEKILEDSVYEKDTVSSKKTLKGSLRVNSLNISGRINDLFFEEFVALSSTDANKILLDRNVTLNTPLQVDELYFEGWLDSTLTPTFEREWLLQDETQIITGPVTFENVHMKLGSNIMNETINNISLRKLFTKSIKINEDATIKHLYTLSKVNIERMDIEGNLNGADFEESIVRSKADDPQEITGTWFFNKELYVNGSLTIEGYLSGLNLTHLCGLDLSDKINLIVGGSVKLPQEPKILSKVNELDLYEKSKEIWMRNENITLKGEHLRFENVEFDNKTTLRGLLNNVNLTDLSKFYLSKSHDGVISEDFAFDDLVIKKWCRMRTATVEGTVNGLHLEQWAQSVLLQDEEQVLEESVRFEIFQTSNLNAEKTVNGLDLTKDVLRMDVEDAVVEGEKTFQALNVLNLTLAEGKSVQGVDVDAWRQNAVKTTGDSVIKGNLTLENAIFNESVIVTGKVNDIYFDSQHLLMTTGNQLVTGVKHFDYRRRTDPGMKIKFFEVSGQIDEVNLSNLFKNQAYSDRKLVFEQPKTFTQGFLADSMEVDGLFHGVNVSEMCEDVFNPIDVNSRRDDFLSLINKTKTLIQLAKDRAFFFDYLEVVQTLKPNIKAVVPTLDSKGNHLIAVFTPNTMTFMDWDEYTEGFVNTDEGLNLEDNVTFVAAEMTKNGSFLYIETKKSAKIFEPKLRKEIEATNTSCIASFELNSLGKSCIFVGQKWNSSRILCNSFLMNDLQTYQWLDSKGSVQVAALTIENETFLAVINKELVFDRIENTLSIYRFDPQLQHFYMSHTIAEVNPVALSSITYKNNHFLVSAGGHLPESVHNSVLTIFRFSKRHRVFLRAQSIQVDTPVDVHFAILPSSQLALYVLTSNPTKPFVMFLHKGMSGFVEETSGLSLYPGSQLYSFTNLKNQHFVIIRGFGRGQILKAGFKGEKSV